MKKFTSYEIDKAMDKAYKESGHNAYFGEGFRAGIEFAQSDPSETVTANWIGFVGNDKDLIKIKEEPSSPSVFISFNMGRYSEKYESIGRALYALKERYDALEEIFIETTSIHKHKNPVKIK